jgi:hypothetical protein
MYASTTEDVARLGHGVDGRGSSTCAREIASR